MESKLNESLFVNDVTTFRNLMRVEIDTDMLDSADFIAILRNDGTYMLLKCKNRLVGKEISEYDYTQLIQSAKTPLVITEKQYIKNGVDYREDIRFK